MFTTTKHVTELIISEDASACPATTTTLTVTQPTRDCPALSLQRARSTGTNGRRGADWLPTTTNRVAAPAQTIVPSTCSVTR
ncbi:hypothetical protein LSAT2_010028 [Lamellibrachia satsuma]|nr:hypothetical protein LSAT2_010028 [Lamellibrachia satsuma]